MIKMPPMSLFLSKPGYGTKIELKSKECVDAVLQPRKDHVTTQINVSLHLKTSFLWL